MTMAERTRPDVPQYAEDVPPAEASFLARVDDFASLFPVLAEWRDLVGQEVTAYASPSSVTTIEEARLLADWEHTPDIRLDTVKGGWVQVSDYREPNLAVAAVPA
ncbi:hypothetical protein ACIRBX_12080 [Kitasatospora sp. NPDC096147]|uniref:hypothetical protein n=1 Tax=Kitasatospora sp. NPDC096147 TaxID=3364093 RepID=UPI00382A78F3